MKSPLKSVTIWFNLLALAAVLPEVAAIIPAGAKPYVAAAVAVVNLALRFRTSQPIRGQ
jgi:hypothetical protein